MKTLTPAQHKAAREAAGLTHQELADAIGVSRVTVTKRESGKLSTPTPVALLLQYMAIYGPPSRALTLGAAAVARIEEAIEDAGENMPIVNVVDVALIGGILPEGAYVSEDGRTVMISRAWLSPLLKAAKGEE